MAGVVFSDSLSAAKAATESRMLNRRRGNSPLSSGWGRQVVVPPLYCSRTAVLVALNGDVSPTATDSLLLFFPSADSASRCPRSRALISTGRQVVIRLLQRIRAAAGRVLRSNRVEELLDSLRHQVALFALEVLQLVSRRLGSADVLRRGSVYGEFSPEQVGDGRAVLPDRARRLGPIGAGEPPTARSISRW